ncbi:MAG: TetR/AcrR family transcriptional regulator [Spirochaetales bacterium]|jgi:TetR/AcrR family transcriptional regulator, repressor of fatR-cypB operon|nr:TetR/AcrR family transcriptional regulator [Spirochaetales bacterium]
MKDKRTAILETTLTLISERGFHNTPMSLIAKTSSVSAGIIYHYFANKEELINELYKEIKLEYIHATLADYSEKSPLKERFYNIWNSFVRYSLSNPTKVLFLDQFENSPLVKHVEEDFTEVVAPFFQLFGQGLEDGSFISLHPLVLFEISFAPAAALVKRHIAGFVEMDDELIQAVSNICWNAITV